MPLLALAWVSCAGVIVTAAFRCRRHGGALRLGRWGVGTLFVAAGAAVNAGFLLAGDRYETFADGAYLAFVRDTWRDLVVPHATWWIGLLIAFELAVGLLAVAGGRLTQASYVLAIAFHVALVSFGWGFYAWSVPMVAALTVLLRAERRAGRDPTVLARAAGRRRPALREAVGGGAA